MPPELMTARSPLRPSDNIPDTLLAMPLPTEGNYRKLTAIPVATTACLVLTTRLLLAQLRRDYSVLGGCHTHF